MTHIASRLEFVTLDELEAGFADRLGPDAVFLPRAMLGATQDMLYVGAPVRVDIETATGEKALSIEGVVAWAYPAAPRTPPGREPGAGIFIDRIVGDDGVARAARMRRRPGAGGRVRVPGTRLPALRIGAAPSTLAASWTPSAARAPVPRPPAGAAAAAPATAAAAPAAAVPSAAARPARGPAAAEVTGPLTTPPLPSSLWMPPTPPPVAPQVAPQLADDTLSSRDERPAFAPPSPSAPGAPVTPATPVPAGAAPRAPVAADAAAAPAGARPIDPDRMVPPPIGPVGDGLVSDVNVDETGEIVVSHPPAPQPRLMAMGLLVDQPFDATPTPGPRSTLMHELEKPSAPGLDLLTDAPDTLPPGSSGGHAASDAVPRPPPTTVVARQTTTASSAPGAPSFTAGPPTLEGAPVAEAPRAISLEGLPEAGTAPPAAFEQRQTDVDLLVSLEDADFFPAELEEQRARARSRVSSAGRAVDPDVAAAAASTLDLKPPASISGLETRVADARDAPDEPTTAEPDASAASAALNPALHEPTVMSLDDLPSAEPDAELPEVDADDVEALPAVLPAPSASGVFAGLAPPAGAESARALVQDTANDPSEEVPAAAVSSLSEVSGESVAELTDALRSELASALVSDEAPPVPSSADGPAEAPAAAAPDASDEGRAFALGEHTAVTMARPPSKRTTGNWDARTEHGPAINPETVEASSSTTEATSSDAEQLALSSSPGVRPPRPLPDLEPFPPPPDITAGIIGTAFLVSHKRGGEVVHAIEPFTWPKNGTKRWNALDAAREDGEDLDIAISQSAWLARDPSAPDRGASEAEGSAFEVGMTDPGVNVADVIGKAVQLADEEGDSVFSDAPAPVRPAMKRPGGDDDTREIEDQTSDGGLDASDVSDEPAFSGADPRTPGLDDDAETDRDMKRPPSKASPETNARLGVLQKFLGRR